MTLIEVLPSIKQLSALEKIRLIRILSEELDVLDDIAPFELGKIYHLPTPYGVYGAGKIQMESMAAFDKTEVDNAS